MNLTDAPLNELIGLAVAVAIALGLLSLLLWAKGLSAGLPRRRVRSALLSLWLIVFGLVALLVVLRTMIGSPIVTGSYAEGGVSLATLTALQWVLVIASAALVIGAAIWTRRLLTPFMGRDLSTMPPPEPASSDNSC